MTSEKVLAILQHHIPEKAVNYCFTLWNEQPFVLKVTKSRQTKVGDFTSRSHALHPRITLNHDLNPFTFLITYIHEVAHLHVFVRYGNRVDPHGVEWKTEFQRLMAPVLTEAVFPPDVYSVLSAHMRNPKASSFADSELTRLLRNFDKGSHNNIFLSDLPEGSMFHLNGRYFTKGKLRRTRVLCKETKSKRHYLVPADALVSNVQLSLL
jgi:SprT protein